MVIQFSCPGCHQPIEVDEEWAGQHVACPFCQRVVTAPTESTRDGMVATVPPVARKAAARAGIGPTEDRSLSPGTPRIALLGLSCSLAAIFLLVLGQIILQPLLDQLGPNPTTAEAQQKLMELASSPQTSGRVVLATGAFAISFACWVAGLVLSILGVAARTGAGYRLAVGGLACAAVPPGICCLGVFLG